MLLHMLTRPSNKKKYSLDRILGCVFAMGLRNPRISFKGKPLRIRRTLDTLEKDIPFSSLDMDTAQVMEFTQPNLLDGSGSAYLNLFSNPTLILDGNNNGIADGLGVFSSGFDGNVSFAIDGGQKLTLSNGTNNGQYVCTTDIVCTAGDIISFSSLAKVSGNGVAGMNATFVDSSANVLSTTSPSTYTANTDWTLVKVENQIAPPNTAKIQIKLRVNTSQIGATTSFWFKDLNVKKSAYITNAGSLTQDSNVDGIADGWATTTANATIASKSVSSQGQYWKSGSSTAQFSRSEMFATVPCVQGDNLKFTFDYVFNKLTGDTYFDLQLSYKTSSGSVVSTVTAWTVGVAGSSTVTTGTFVVPADATITQVVLRFTIKDNVVGGGSTSEATLNNVKAQKIGSAYIPQFYDESGNNNNAVQTTTSYQPRLVSNGVLDVAPYFDGTDDYLKVGDNTNLKSSDVSGIVTFMPTDLSAGFRTLLNYGNGTSYSTNNWQLGLNGSSIGLQGRTPTTFLVSGVNAVINTVIQVGFRYSNGNATFFINGVKGNMVSVNFANGDTAGLFIGCSNGTLGFFKGNIYDSVVFNRQLTDTEFAKYYSDTKKKIPTLP